MILRPLQPPAGAGAKVSAWAAVEQSQTPTHVECWLITQPAHSALSADIARALSAEAFGAIDEKLAKAFALHDAGWSATDAGAIHASRANGKMPESFIHLPPAQTIPAWTSSIETAAKISALGGVVVSLHFSRIAASQSGTKPATEQASLKKFLKSEEARRAGSARKIECSADALERLADALQFCDLFSLLICCGTQGEFEFPQTIAGDTVTVRIEGGKAKFAQPIFMEGPKGHHFAIGGLRHPRPAGKHAIEENVGHFAVDCR